MPSYQYLIKTHTGTAPTAGTTASIAIQLCGSEGRFKDFKKLDNQKSEDYVSGGYQQLHLSDERRPWRDWEDHS